MGKLIIDCPRFGHKEYLINTQTSDKVVDKTCNDILAWFTPQAAIDFIELW